MIMPAATENIIKRSGCAADAGADGCASANIGMSCRADAGSRSTTQGRAGQSAAAGNKRQKQTAADHRPKPSFYYSFHGPPPPLFYKGKERSIDRLGN